MDERERIGMDFVDAVLDRPKGFSAGKRHFFLWPVTLGKMLLTRKLTEQLEINRDILHTSPFAEALRLMKAHRDDCLLLITYHTLKTKDEVNNSRTVAIRKGVLSKELDDKDIATLLILCLTWDNTASFMRYTKVDAELERMKEVLRVKKNKNTLMFGGVSVYGSLIDQACERYGWTYDYVVWGISYINLKMMLNDGIKSVYLSDEEAAKCNIYASGDIIDGNDAGMMATVISEGGWD